MARRLMASGPDFAMWRPVLVRALGKRTGCEAAHLCCDGVGRGNMVVSAP